MDLTPMGIVIITYGFTIIISLLIALLIKIIAALLIKFSKPIPLEEMVGESGISSGENSQSDVEIAIAIALAKSKK